MGLVVFAAFTVTAGTGYKYMKNRNITEDGFAIGEWKDERCWGQVRSYSSKYSFFVIT
jgi:hypothetical protein